jgi:hypothetical protein
MLAYPIAIMAIDLSIIDTLFIVSCGPFMVSMDLFHIRYSHTFDLRFGNDAHFTVSVLQAFHKSCRLEHTFEPDPTCECV